MFIVASILLILSATAILLCLAIHILSRQSPLIFGKYPCKGFFYQLKYWIALVVVRQLRNRIYHRNEQILSSPEHLDRLDRPQSLTNDPKSYDVVSFMAANATTGHKLLITMERRRRGVIKAALYLWLPNDGGLLSLPQLPDMVHFTSPDGSTESTEFHGAGFHIYPEQSMRLWRLEYNGKLSRNNNNNVDADVDADAELIDVQLRLQFKATVQHFDYNRDLSSSVIADSVAREAWNERFYGMLKCVGRIVERRTHYEQSGSLTGTLQLGGEQRRLELQLSANRDHSFGTERCLSSINRYVYFALFLDDGTSMVVGNLSQPSFFLSSLKVGYVCDGKTGQYYPITACNFELYSYGEKGTPPHHQNFIVQTETGTHFVQIRVQETAVRYVGGDWESKVYNQFVECTVNGIGGHGIAEYLYRHNGGRPKVVSDLDPQWYQRIKRFERSLSNMQPTPDDDREFIF